MSSHFGNKIRIGDLLVNEMLISEEQLKSALKEQKEHGGKLGDILVHLEYIEEETLLRTLANQLHLPYIELNSFNIKPEIVQKVPEKIARRHKVLLIGQVGNHYMLGMADPLDISAFDAVSKVLKEEFIIAVVKQADLLSIIDKMYRRTEDIASFANELNEELSLSEENIIEFDSLGEDLSEESAPVVKMLDSIFEDAIQVNASDVHIEPDEKALRIRQRVDGKLHENIIPNKAITAALVLRIKLMANLNISEKRIPQDGRFHIKVKGKKLDIRVSTMPVKFGESIVMRILDQSSGILRLEEVGMPSYVYEKVRYMLHRPNGMILVTGPTGSGKTTTLYAGLNEINEESKKIITIEDPVEYTLERINQVQVQSKIGLDFATVLRAALRQDPDIVMVGEIRDKETVDISLRASMTGHLVLSTLHTNDAISTAVRFLDMGAEPFSVASALKLILSQRLVAKNCKSCVKEAIPLEEEKLWLKKILGFYDETWKFSKGKGCVRCSNYGLQGRMPVYEMLEITHELSDCLRDNDTQIFIDKAVEQESYCPLAISALGVALTGKIPISEVLRVASEIDVKSDGLQREKIYGLLKMVL